jgi:hypothetical protein
MNIDKARMRILEAIETKATQFDLSTLDSEKLTFADLEKLMPEMKPGRRGEIRTSTCMGTKTRRW